MRLRSQAFPFGDSIWADGLYGFDREIKNLLDTLGPEAKSTTHEGSRETQFKETEKAYLLSFDLPGVNKESLEIEAEGEALKIKAKKRNLFFDENEEEKDNSFTIERKISLPQDVETDKIQAHLEDGILYLALPKVEAATPKKIDISSGEKTSSWKNLLGFAKSEQ